MFKHKRTRLCPVTRAAALIEARHCKTACRFENVHSMRIMALDAVHAPFDYRMPHRQSKFGMDLEMTLETCRWIFAGVHDELAASASCLDMFAPGAMAGLATCPSRQCARRHEHAH